VSNTYHSPGQLTPGEEAELEAVRDQLRAAVTKLDRLIRRIDARIEAES
jgi:uncharacterized protein (DUF2342 family)